MNDTYILGETVTVTVSGRIVAADPQGLLIKRSDEGTINVKPGADDVTIKRVTPADGVPMLGDIWADRLGTEYFAIDATTGGAAYRLRPANGQPEMWRDVHRGPLGPITLVYRPAPSPAPAMQAASGIGGES